MIHWTRQIKEVLNAQEALETAESAGPLEEIEFWNNRCIDLSGEWTYFFLRWEPHLCCNIDVLCILSVPKNTLTLQMALGIVSTA